MFQNSLVWSNVSLKTQSGCKDGFVPLPSLHCARRERLPISYELYMVDDRYIGVAGENEIAVHAVDGERIWNGLLSGGETLRNDRTAINTSGSGRMP